MTWTSEENTRWRAAMASWATLPQFNLRGRDCAICGERAARYALAKTPDGNERYYVFCQEHAGTDHLVTAMSIQERRAK